MIEDWRTPHKWGSKYLATGSQDSQHCLTVAVKPFLYTHAEQYMQQVI